jgi:hypothetical protein
MSSANIIEFSGYRKAKTPQPLPQPKQLPWHINEALWILQETGEMEDRLFLNGWEIKFVTSMAVWRGNLTPKQRAILKKLGDKVETASKKQQQPLPTPPDAA